MKKSQVMLLLVLSIFGGCGSAMAYEGKKGVFFTALDYWTVGKAYKNTEDAYKSDVSLAVGAETITEGVSRSGGVGARFGGFFQSPVKGLDLGGSLGYIIGPSAKFTEDDVDVTVPFSLHSVDDYKTHYIRVLAQVQQSLPVSEQVAIRLGAGAGVAFGSMDRNLTCVATGFASCVDDSASRSFSGFTYEVGPSVAYTGGRVNVDLGILYAGFPTMNSFTTSGGLPVLPIKWNPIGVRLGVEF